MADECPFAFKRFIRPDDDGLTLYVVDEDGASPGVTLTAAELWLLCEWAVDNAIARRLRSPG